MVFVHENALNLVAPPIRESISLPPLLQRGGLREKIAQHFEVKSSEFRV